MKNSFIPYLRVTAIFFLFFGAIEYFIDGGDRPAIIKYPIIVAVLAVFLITIIALELMYNALMNMVNSLMTAEQREAEKLEKIAQREKNKAKWRKLTERFVTGKPAADNEQALLLNHDYDGIHELDNNLPKWWIYLFYLTIFFAGIYLVRYEILGADDQEAEFRNEMAQAAIDVAEWKKTAPDLMDEKTVTLLTEPAELAKGKSIFDTNCAACHRADGGGQIGPNLTDDHWIFGGDIKTIFHTITNGGRDGKGMVAWKGTLKPREIQHVGSYILSLQGSNPKDPKAAEGDVIVSAATKPVEEKPAK